MHVRADDGAGDSRGDPSNFTSYSHIARRLTHADLPASFLHMIRTLGMPGNASGGGEAGQHAAEGHIAGPASLAPAGTNVSLISQRRAQATSGTTPNRMWMEAGVARRISSTSPWVVNVRLKYVA